MKLTRIQSRIEAVTVYREGASVRRVADLASADGSYAGAVCITGLPLSIEDSSVRVRVQAADGADPGGRLPVASDIRVTLDVPDTDESLPPPVADELKAARQQVRVLNGRISQAKRELARVERMVIAARPRLERERTERPGPSPTESRLALLLLRESHERTLRQNLLDLERQLYDAELEAKRLRARHDRATSARQASEHELRKALVVTLHDDDRAAGEKGAAPERVALTIDYIVPGARWSPAYTVRLSPSGEASLAMRAAVAQHTGEDWGAIELTLSTADAHSWTELPELNSIRIGRRQSTSRKTGWRPPPSGVAELFGDYDRELKDRLRIARAGRDTDKTAQWEDDTREITTRRAPVRADTAPGDLAFGAALPQGGFMDDLDEPTVPNLRPPAPPPARPAPMAMPSMAPPMAGGPPPPSPGYAPRAPARSSAPRKKRAKGGRGGGPSIGGMPGGIPGGAPSGAQLFGGGPPGSQLAPKPDMAARTGGGGYGGGGGAYAEQREEEDITIINASSDMLSYASLRMPAANDASRGRLTRAHQRDIYMELLIEQRVEVTFNVLAVIASATHQAKAVARKPLPPRHRLAGNDRYDYAYRTDTPVDVPSDGNFHSIALTSVPADTDLSYVVVPREATDVFRLARLKNPLGAPILDGPADIYLGKDFLLTSDIAFTPPGGEVKLGLGVEQAIKVTRNTSYREETSGLLRGSLVLWHKIEIEVQNHLERPVECQVRERIPSTRKGEDDIEVKIENADPAWQSYRPKAADSPEVNLKGGHSWTVEVPGKGGKRALSATYSIKIPSKYELIGGNRREV